MKLQSNCSEKNLISAPPIHKTNLRIKNSDIDSAKAELLHMKSRPNPYSLKHYEDQKASTNVIMNYMKYTLGLWNRFTWSNEVNDDLTYSKAYNNASQLIPGLFRDYICYRLKRNGFAGKFHISACAPASDQRLSNRILNIGFAFEKSNPSLYKHLARRLGYIFDAEQTLRRLFYRLATHVMGTESKNFTWGRILSLFCIGGAMAVDCVAQGHAELVESVIKISSDFTKNNLLEWIVSHGGWEGMTTHFYQRRYKKVMCSASSKNKSIYFVGFLFMFSLVFVTMGLRFVLESDS